VYDARAYEQFLGDRLYRPVLSEIATSQRETGQTVGQTVGWIKMKLGMQVGLGPGHIVLDGDPARPPPKKGAQSSPNFRPMSVVARIPLGT